MLLSGRGGSARSWPCSTRSSRFSAAFVQEVRRISPFAPFVGAQARRDFDWQGYRFPAGTLVLLDIYGANHDPGLWQDPESFMPERFHDWKLDAFDFIPQGGGPFEAGHRCAGEWITIEVTEVAVSMLTRSMTYTVPVRISPYLSDASPPCQRAAS